ncbi:ESPR domain-containing protein, partial [Phascolarctobacterium succinatutens]|uniref:ESPR domain-containing protein n=1 Tax=Phascolarctobacterium succinatutens TaxID=626940 RepID=UPI00307BD527
MNKVFKVIWSEARNAYVVVSEIAKNHGSKSCSTKKLLAMLIATGVMTCASMAPAMAADPPAEALKHSTVTNGDNITVTEGLNKDGGKEYNVDLKNDINLAGDDPDALVSISGSKGTIWATGSVTVGSGVDGSVVMDGTTATVSGLGNTTTAYDGFANGEGKA